MKFSLQEQETLERFRRVISSKYGLVRHIHSRPVHPGGVAFFSSTFEQADFDSIGGGRMRGYGSGFTAAESLISGLGETLERYCADFIPHHAVTRNKSYQDLMLRDLPCLSPDQVPQYADFQFDLPHFRFIKYKADTLTDWVEGENLKTGKPILMPLGFAVSKYRPQDFIQNTTNANACGSTKEQALLNGFLELIERDTFLFHWWTKTPLQPIDLWSCQDPRIVELKNNMGSDLENISLWLAQTDLPFPVFIARYKSPNDPTQPALSVAAACSLDPIRMARKAVLELCSCLAALRRTSQRWQGVTPDFQFDTSIKSFIDAINFYATQSGAELANCLWGAQSPRALDEFTDLSRGSFTADLDFTLSSLYQCGYDALAVDITTRDVRSCGFHVYKTLIPQLMDINSFHLYRRWGNPRLYTLKQKLGLASSPLKIPDLNPFPHPFP